MWVCFSWSGKCTFAFVNEWLIGSTHRSVLKECLLLAIYFNQRTDCKSFTFMHDLVHTHTENVYKRWLGNFIFKVIN